MHMLTINHILYWNSFTAETRNIKNYSENILSTLLKLYKLVSYENNH